MISISFLTSLDNNFPKKKQKIITILDLLKAYPSLLDGVKIKKFNLLTLEENIMKSFFSILGYMILQLTLLIAEEDFLVTENRLTASQANLFGKTGFNFKPPFAFNKRSYRIERTDHYGNKTIYEYNVFNHLVKIIHPAIPKSNGELFNPTENFEYDELGYITKTRDGNNNLTIQLNNAQGQPYQIQYPDGSIEKMTYFANGNLQKKILKNGMQISYTYDDEGRVITRDLFSPQGEPLGSHSYAYSATYLIKEVDAKGHITSYQYNAQGQLTGIIKEDATTYYTYDSLSRLETTKILFGYGENDYTLKTCAYDSQNHIIEESQEDAFKNIFRKLTYAYDINGNQIETTTYSNTGTSTTKTIFDLYKKPISITNAENNVTFITYRYDYKDAYGLTVPYSETTDSNGNVIVSIYNTHNKIATLQVKNGLGQIIRQKSFFYDGVDQLIELREKIFKLGKFDREVTTKWTYTSMGNIASCTEAVGTPKQKSTIHTFNKLSQKTSTLKPDGTILYFTYDAKGNLATVSSSDQTLSYAYSYDLNDNPILIRDLIQNTQNTRVYDRSDRLIEETLGNGLNVQYAYDRQGRIHSYTLPDQGQVVYTYNAVDLIKIERFNLLGERLYSQSYHWDQAGNLIQKDLPFNLGATTYAYDLLNQYKSMQSPHFSELQTSYDAVGNLLTQVYTDPLGCLLCQYSYDDLYQLDSESNCADHVYQYNSLLNRFAKDDQLFEFNALNQLLADELSAYIYDANGNLTNHHGQKYTYDAWNRLLTVTIGNTCFSYTYDSFNRRLSKSKAVWDAPTKSWITQDIQYFLYQGENEVGACNEQLDLMEFRSLGYGQGAEIGAAVAFEIQNQVYVPLTNSMGHVQVLLSSEGEPVDIYRYTAFGEEMIFDPSGNSKIPTTAWRFCSKRRDPETDLIYFGKRYYDPQTARWITINPLGYTEGCNLYAYTRNNPLIYVDLYGDQVVNIKGSNFFRN